MSPCPLPLVPPLSRTPCYLIFAFSHFRPCTYSRSKPEMVSTASKSVTSDSDSEDLHLSTVCCLPLDQNATCSTFVYFIIGQPTTSSNWSKRDWKGIPLRRTISLRRLTNHHLQINTASLSIVYGLFTSWDFSPTSDLLRSSSIIHPVFRFNHSKESSSSK